MTWPCAARWSPPASSSSTRTVGARGCGFDSGTKRRVRQQATEFAGTSNSAIRCGQGSGTPPRSSPRAAAKSGLQPRTGLIVVRTVEAATPTRRGSMRRLRTSTAEISRTLAASAFSLPASSPSLGNPKEQTQSASRGIQHPGPRSYWDGGRDHFGTVGGVRDRGGSGEI